MNKNEKVSNSTMVLVSTLLAFLGFIGTLSFLSGNFKYVTPKIEYLKLVTESNDTFKLKVNYLDKFHDTLLTEDSKTNFNYPSGFQNNPSLELSKLLGSGQIPDKDMKKDNKDYLSFAIVDTNTKDTNLIKLNVSYLNNFQDTSQTGLDTFSLATDSGTIKLEVSYVNRLPDSSQSNRYVKFVTDSGSTLYLKISYSNKFLTSIEGINMWKENNNGYLKFKTNRDDTIGLKGSFKKLQIADTVLQTENLIYNIYPGLYIWSLVYSILAAISLGLIPFYFSFILNLCHDFSSKGLITIIIIVAAFGIVILLMDRVTVNVSTPKDYIDIFKILFKKSCIITVISNIAVGMSLFGLIPLLMIPRAAETLPKIFIVKENKKISSEEITLTETKFKKLESIAEYCLYGLTIVVTLSVVTTGTLRETIVKTIQITGFELMPKELAYMYGLFFSVILASVYLPIYFYMKNIGQEILAGVRIYDENNNTKTADTVKESFDLNQSIPDKIKGALVILSPFISSLLTSYLPFFSGTP